MCYFCNKRERELPLASLDMHLMREESAIRLLFSSFLPQLVLLQVLSAFPLQCTCLFVCFNSILNIFPQVRNSLPRMFFSSSFTSSLTTFNFQFFALSPSVD